MNRTRMLSILALSTVALSACSWFGNGAAEQAMEDRIKEETGQDADVQMDEDGMEVKTDDGTATFGGDVPADWPSDVPVYEGAKVQYTASTNPANGRPGNMMVLQSTDASDDVYAFYQQALVDNGWTVESQANAAGANTLVAKKEGRTVSLLVTPVQDATAISIGIEDDEVQE